MKKEQNKSTRIRAKKISSRNFLKSELRKGIKREKEYTKDPKKATKIAVDRLSEDLNYYNKTNMEDKKMKKEKEMPEKKEKCEDKAEHLDHPQMKKDTIKLCNDCAPHLHHNQIPAASGHVEEQFDPKKGFKPSTSIIGKK